MQHRTPAQSRSTWVVPSLLAAVSLLAGCANLDAVGRFARTSAATADYGQIVSDYAAASERQMQFTPVSRQEPLKAEAAVRRAQQKKLLAAQAILVIYMSVLGDLAANDLTRTDADFDSLRKAVTGLPFLKAGESAAVSRAGSAAVGLASVITGAIFNHWRQAQINSIITDADPHVQVVIAGLREIVLADFDMAVTQEKEAMWKFFQKSATAAENSPEPEGLPPIAMLLWNERADQAETRRARLKPYAGVLQKIAEGHADLAKNVGKLSNEQLKTRIEGYVKDLMTLHKAIEALAE